MNEIVVGIFEGLVVVLLGFNLILMPLFFGHSYLMKRDCELIHNTSCVWQMMPELKGQGDE